jgi:hypothetical protein
MAAGCVNRPETSQERAKTMARCDAKLSKDYLRSRRNDPEIDGRCRRIAEWSLEGVQLCCEHMSLRLLERAKSTGIIQPVERLSEEKEYRTEARIR